MENTTVTREHVLARRGARWACGVIAAAALVLSACAAQHATDTPASPAPTVPRSELRVGIAPIYPPLAFKRDGRITGVEVQFAQLLGPALGARMKLVEMPWEDLIPALRESRIDIIMSGMSITGERKQLVSFAHPYLRVGQMMLLRRADAKRLSSDAAINHPKTRVGFVTGTTGEQYVHQHLSRAQSQGFDSVDGAVAALRSGKIDVFVHDAPSIYSFTTAGEHELMGRYEPLTEEYLAWAVRQDDNDLRTRLDAVLKKWNADGTLDRVLGKWIKTRRNPPGAK